MNREFWYLHHDLQWLSWVPEPTIQYTLGVLGVTVILGHFLVWRRVDGRAFWAVVEYAWLAVAAVSVLAAVGEYRRTLAGDQLPDARLSRRIAWDRATEAVDNAIHMLAQPSREGLFISDTSKPADLTAAIAEADGWFADARQVLSQGIDSGGWRRYLQQGVPARRSPNLGRLDAEREYVLRTIRRLDDIENEIVRFAMASRQTMLEGTILILSPWLLAAALGLRICRASASLRGLC